MENDFIFDPIKNTKLKRERGVGFEDAICAICDGALLEIRQHHNQNKYPGQKVMLVEINDYIYQVPYMEENGKIILKTVFPSRKFTKILKKQGEIK